MSEFSDFLKTKLEFFDDPRTGKDEEYDEDLIKIVKTAVEEHRDEVMEFLKQIGQYDHRIQDALEELRQRANNDMADFGRRGRNPFKDGLPPGSLHGRPGHEIVPSSADTVTGDGSGPGGG